jgi:hypothetical protein
MKKRPLSIVIIAVFYFLEPIGNLVSAAYFNKMPLFGKDSILFQLMWSDWIILLLFPVVGIGIYMVKKWGWYLFLAFSALLIFYNIYVYKYLNPNYSLETVILFILVVTVVSALFLRKSIYAPYFNPRLRWWEAAKRFRVPLDAVLFTKNGSLSCTTLDISETGCFLELQDDLPLDSRVIVEFRFSGIEISSVGRIVHKRTGPGEKHSGYGIQFQALTQENREKIRTLLLYFEKIGLADRTDSPQMMTIPESVFQQKYGFGEVVEIKLKSFFRRKAA